MREFLQERLQNWRDEVPCQWAEPFDQALANFCEVDPAIQPPQQIFPPMRAEGDDQNRFLLKAFDGITPEDVRVIIIGQDPYPDANRATGRAFEDGAVEWVSDSTSPSLRRLVQSAAAAISAPEELARNDADWDTLRAELNLPIMAEYFQGLTEQGVICINAAWTFTGATPQHLSANLRLWRPVVRHLVQQVIQRNENCVVLALGKKAQKLFNTKCPRPNYFIEHCHPQARGGAWFARPNPLIQVNHVLGELGQEPICWLPGATCRWANDR